MLPWARAMSLAPPRWLRSTTPWLFAGLAALAVAAPAEALTAPLTGATLFPTTGPALRLPFPAGARVGIASSYGPSSGSSLHRNVTDPSHGNDHYALDLVYDGEPNGGRGMPVVAALPGTVVRAGWATSGWANFGQRVILQHDLGDGHVYYSLYAHLNAITVEVGATLAQGQIIGELGGSCQGALSCSSFSGPHLHFSLHRDSEIGGSGTGGSYGGNAVVPEPIDGYEDLLRGQVLVSMNAESTVCGDGYCSGDESNASCPGDCPVCEPIPMAGRVVDESELCFSRGGDPTYWNAEGAGWESSLVWTHTTDAADADNHGIWALAFDEAGEYRLEVYTDAGFAQAQQASYTITHDGSTEAVILDQSEADGWRELGSFRFGAGGGQQVRLDDNTGEPFTLRRQIVFDAIRLTRLDGSVPDPDAGAPSGDASIAPSVDGGIGRPMEPGASCSCRAAGAPTERAPAGLLLVLGMLGLALRRRR
jgi:MYXO-CTERM domain-containing protein